MGAGAQCLGSSIARHRLCSSKARSLCFLLSLQLDGDSYDFAYVYGLTRSFREECLTYENQLMELREDIKKHSGIT